MYTYRDMDKASRYLFLFVVLAILAVGAYKYKAFVIDRNFDILAHVTCDPQSESCFVADCSPEDDPECDITPYKKVLKSAKNIEECGPSEECPELSCDENEVGCTTTYCSSETIDEDEICAETIVNPIEPEESPDAQESEESATSSEIEQ